MKKNTGLAFVFCCSSICSYAQTKSVKNVNQFIDFTIGIGGQQGSAAIAYLYN